MKRSFIVTITPMLLAVASAAQAEVYKCDGPNGPVFSDYKCGSDATTVEFEETSGISGVSDEVKADLARKKEQREKAESELEPNPNANPSYQFNTINTEPAGYWYPGSYWLPGNRPPHVRPPRPPQPPPEKPPETSVIRLKR
jgi:hypothetical protein